MALSAKSVHSRLGSSFTIQHPGTQSTSEQQHSITCSQTGLHKGHECGANFGGQKVGCWRTFSRICTVKRRHSRLNRCKILAAVSSEQSQRTTSRRSSVAVTTTPAPVSIASASTTLELAGSFTAYSAS